MTAVHMSASERSKGGVSDEDLKATLAGGGNLLEFESESASVEREFVNFKPLTDYTVAALAFDADGVAGGFYRADFTTLDLIPGEDSEAYRKYIGTWALTFYTDAARRTAPIGNPLRCARKWSANPIWFPA